MKCPACAGGELRKVRAGDGTEVDGCPSCKGAWLDKAEIYRFFRDPERLNKELAAAYAIALPSKRVCPRCGQGLAEVTSPSASLSFEACPGCEGNWFDADEAVRLIRALDSARPAGFAPEPPTAVTPAVEPSPAPSERIQETNTFLDSLSELCARITPAIFSDLEAEKPSSRRLAVTLAFAALAWAFALADRYPLSSGPYVRPRGYDAERNGKVDILAAVAEARRTGKRVLLTVGGDWDEDCKALERFYVENPEVSKFRDRHFVSVRVGIDRDNDQRRALYRLPQVRGYPHFFVLDRLNRVTDDEAMVNVVDNAGYQRNAFMAFLSRAALPP